MVNPAIISTGLQIGSQLAGSLFGDKGPSAREQIQNGANSTALNSEYQIAGLMKAAKTHKLHPLSVLGSGGAQASTPIYNNTGDNLGQNIGNTLAKGVSSYMNGKTQSKIDSLNLERAQLENDLLRSQISSINGQPTGQPSYSMNNQSLPQSQKYETLPDENTSKYSKDPGLTAGSKDPSPAGKKFTVGNTPYGKVYINLPPSGQADEYGEVYGAVKGLEYMAKRGYVHYANGVYKIGKKLRKTVQSLTK